MSKQFTMTEKVKQEIKDVLQRYGFYGKVILYSKYQDSKLRLMLDLVDLPGGFDQGMLMTDEIEALFGGSNYVDWTNIHAGDIESIKDTDPELYVQLVKGETLNG